MDKREHEDETCSPFSKTETESGLSEAALKDSKISLVLKEQLHICVHFEHFNKHWTVMSCLPYLDSPKVIPGQMMQPSCHHILITEPCYPPED